MLESIHRQQHRGLLTVHRSQSTRAIVLMSNSMLFGQSVNDAVVKMSQDSCLDLLREELQSEETFLRVNAIHRVPIVATLLGPEAVKNQLLPFLNSTVPTEIYSQRTTRCCSLSHRNSQAW